MSLPTHDFVDNAATMMRSICLKLGQWGLIVAAVGGLAAVSARATEFTYTGNSCGMFGCGFNAPANWTPVGGPPGLGDIATIAMPDVILLTADTQAMTLLSIGGGASVFTGPHDLNVTNGVGFTEVIDNSNLVVTAGAPLFGFATDTLSLRLGGELDMNGGGMAANFAIRVSTTSVISGNGTVGLTASAAVGLDLAGTIRPEGGDLFVTSANGPFDLDGNSAGEDLGGLLDVIYDGDLVFTGTLAPNDPFGGRMDIGNNNKVQFSTALPFDGELNITSGTSSRLVAPTVTFQSGADVSVQAADGEIQGDATFQSGSEVFLLNAADDLELFGDSTIHSGAAFSGNGAVKIEGGGTMKLLDGANVGVRVLNTGASALVVGSSAGNATVAGYVQDAASLLPVELGGLAPGDDFDQLVVTGDATLGGILDVSLIGGFTLSPGRSFEILDIGGLRTGTFTGFGEGQKVDTLGGVDLFISYAGGDGNDVILFTAGFSADFDGDGDVTGADFLIWQSNFGTQSGADASDGDADDDGDVDDDDFASWADQFGNLSAASSASAAVPEPGTGVLLTSVAAAVGRIRRHRRVIL